MATKPPFHPNAFSSKRGLFVKDIAAVVMFPRYLGPGDAGVQLDREQAGNSSIGDYPITFSFDAIQMLLDVTRSMQLKHNCCHLKSNLELQQNYKKLSMYNVQN